VSRAPRRGARSSRARVAPVRGRRASFGATLLAIVAFVLCAASAPAHAQEGGVKQTPPSSEASAEADRLFREARRLIDDKRYDQACPMLAESQRLDPAGGTALTLALCHQAAGRLATAVRAFEAALTFAERDRRADRAKVARDAIASLTPTLSHLTLRLEPGVAALEGLHVELDGVPLEPGDFDVARPIDGGSHEVVARAPGRQGVNLRFPARVREDELDLTVPWMPPLAAEEKPAPLPLPVAPAKPAEPAPAPPPSRTVRTAVTIGAFGVALVGGVAATWLGLSARADDAEADDLCPDTPCSNEDARREAWMATAATGIAIAGAVTGAVLLFTWPSDGAAAASTGRSGWSISAGARGVALRGAF